jgi:exopolysaccharide biosynthesis polyprenyl glycosylphosphotransferase
MKLHELSGISEERPFDPLPVLIQQIRSEAHSHLIYRAGKRVFDIVMSLGLIVLSFPVMIVIGVAVKLTSAGPILFRQERVGIGGKTFTFIKFRSMTHNADTSIHEAYMRRLIRGEVAASEGGEHASLYKLHDDPRVTPLGRILRKTSLDELPQLFNVLAGSMSLVGPRPPIPYEVNAYKSWHMQRLRVKPGVTGLWQVSGRSATSFDEMVRLDLDYIQRRSLAFDLKILLRTIPAALNTKTAA